MRAPLSGGVASAKTFPQHALPGWPGESVAATGPGAKSNEAYARFWRLRDDLRVLWVGRSLLGEAPVALHHLSPARWPTKATTLSNKQIVTTSR